MNKSFLSKMGLKHECVLSTWQLSILIVWVLHETKTMALGRKISLSYESRNWEMSALLFADDALLLDVNDKPT